MGKKIIVVLITVLLSLSMISCAQTEAQESTQASSSEMATEAPTSNEANTEATEDKEPFILGCFNPMTGNSAQLGLAAIDGAKLAVKEINASGGIDGRMIELITYDDKSSPEEAVKVVTRMLEVDKVNGIIGSLHSGNVQAAGPIVEEAEIPLIGLGTSPVWLQKGWTYLFRSSINTYYTLLSLMDVSETLDFETMAILHTQDEYGKSGKDTMVTMAQENGMNVIGVESFAPGDKDFTAQLTKLISLNPDVFYIVALSEDLGPILKQLRANGFDGYVLGDQAYGATYIKEVAGEALDKVIFTASYVIPETIDQAETPLLKDFLEKYQEEYGKMIVSDNGFRAYDAVYIMAEGIRIANSIDGIAIRDAINSISDFEGLAGSFNYVGMNGEGLIKANGYIIIDGKNIPIEEYISTLE